MSEPSVKLPRPLLGQLMAAVETGDLTDKDDLLANVRPFYEGELGDPPQLRRRLVLSERRTYEGPIMGNNPNRMFFLARNEADTMIGFWEKTFEALGSPEWIEVEVTSD